MQNSLISNEQHKRNNDNLKDRRHISRVLSKQSDVLLKNNKYNNKFSVSVLKQTKKWNY